MRRCAVFGPIPGAFAMLFLREKGIRIQAFTSQVGDTILRGSRQRIKFEIVTNESKALSDEIIATLKHSVTVVPAKGMFSGRETEMLICVVQKHQVVAMEKIIAAHPGAFAYSTIINETLGNFDKIRYNIFDHLKKK